MSVDNLIRYLDASPTANHAAREAILRLEEAGFKAFGDASDDWPCEAGYVQFNGSVIAWRRSANLPPTAPLRIVGAHTDSPGFRIKPNPVLAEHGVTRLGVEVYGGPLLNSWLDRDLGIAGTVHVTTEHGMVEKLVLDREPQFRIPQLAIHLDRTISTDGLKLDRQRHLPLLWALGHLEAAAFSEYLADLTDIEPSHIRGWTLTPFDVTPARLTGRGGNFLASGRLDDLVGCHSALCALINASPSRNHQQVVVLFDHEEVGSATAAGAQSQRLIQTLERVALSFGVSRSDFLASLATSNAVSVDMAHGTHPGYPERHDPQHLVLLGGGPVIKHNAQQRYATSPQALVSFTEAAESENVALQHFVAHSEMPCGSTIGPMLETSLGVPTIDVGIAQYAMHSIREVCGTQDPPRLTQALTAYFCAQ